MLLALLAMLSPDAGALADGIDTHLHLSLGPAGNVSRSADLLIQMMDEAGLSVALVMPPPHVKGQPHATTVESILPATRKHPERLKLVAGGGDLNPMLHALAEDKVSLADKNQFRAQAQRLLSQGAVAFGEMTALHFSFGENHPFEQVPTDHPLLLLLSEIAAEADVPIDLHLEAVPKDQPTPPELLQRSSRNPPMVKATLPGLERLLAHRRKTRVVWQHVGWDNTGHLTPALLGKLLAAHPNLYCGIKFVPPDREPFQQGNQLVDAAGKSRPEWLKLLEEHSDRFVVGSDEFVIAPPPGRPRRGPPQSFHDTWKIIRALPARIREKIAWENARRIYRLGSSAESSRVNPASGETPGNGPSHGSPGGAARPPKNPPTPR